MNNGDRSERALKIARQYRGQVEGRLINPEPYAAMRNFFPDYLDMTEDYLLADVMSRPVLTLREHSMIIITTLMCIRFEGGLKGHMNWALNAGLSKEEVSEIIMHASRYGGWPSEREITVLIDEAYPGFLSDDENPLGRVWDQPGLSSREHIMIKMAAFAALRFSERLKDLIISVLDKDLTREEILEIIMQVTPFSGWPVGTEAILIADKAFKTVN
jgi:4-carboxymuconolactone decarboxylase